VRPLVRIAMAGAWRSGTADRLRSLLVVCCVAAMCVMASGFLSVGNAHERATERVQSRGYAPAAVDASATYMRSVLFDVAPSGSQIVVVTWSVVDGSPLPRGFPQGAVPDAFYVSPALGALVDASPILSERFPGAQKLDTNYVGQADELLAYRLARDPAGLDERLLGQPGAEGVGEVTLPKGESTLVPTLLLLVLPGVGLVWAGASAPATKLRRRLDLLNTLGASSAQVRLVALLHSLAIVVPGVLIGAAVRRIASARLTHIPLTDLAVLPGDLVLSGIQSAAIAIAVTALYSFTLARSSLMDHRVSRRASDLMPMGVLGLLALLIAPILGGKAGFALLLCGVGSMIAGAPALVERIYQSAGERLVSVGKWQTVIVGRQLTSAARGTARSQMAWLGLLVLAPVASSWIATIRIADPHPTSELSVVQAKADDIGGIRDWLEGQIGATSAQVAVERIALDDPREPLLRLVAECEELGAVLQVSDCPALGDFRLNPAVGILARFESNASNTVPNDFELDSSVLLFFETGGRALENSLRAVSVRTPGLSVSSEVTFRQQESPLVSYVLGAVIAMTIVTALALTLVIAGQAARSAKARRRLVMIGAPARAVASVAALEAAVVVGLAGVSTIPLTAVAIWIMERIESATIVPVVPLVWVAVAIVGGTAIASIAAGASTRTDEVQGE